MARNTKASRILNDAAMRLEAARMRRHTAQSQLNAAIATHDALQEAYDALEKELTPTPRKKTTTKLAAAQKESTKSDPIPEGLCSYKYPEGHVCLAPAGNAIHDKSMGYAGYHPFQSSAPVVAKRSRQKSAATQPTPSIANEVESVSAVGVGAGD